LELAVQEECKEIIAGDPEVKPAATRPVGSATIAADVTLFGAA
jgi:hypothetical protein